MKGMPSYIVTCQEGRLTGSQKSQIAEAVTRAHGDSTGAPYYFARITFNEVKPGSYFLGGTQLDGDQIFVHATIREGRPSNIEVKRTFRMLAVESTEDRTNVRAGEARNQSIRARWTPLAGFPYQSRRSQAQSCRLIENEIVKWTPIVRALDIKID